MESAVYPPEYSEQLGSAEQNGKPDRNEGGFTAGGKHENGYDCSCYWAYYPAVSVSAEIFCKGHDSRFGERIV